MTLDEAIIHAEKVAEHNYDLAEHVYHTDEGVYMKEKTKCRECAEEHEQLAEWLKELKALREQKRPHGEWVDLSDGWQEGTYECSNCKTEFVLTEGTPEDNEYNFCPNCGADMREGERK